MNQNLFQASKNIVPAVLLATMVLIQSCGKNDDVVIPAPETGDKTFAVSFNDTTLDLQQMDSAVVIFKRAGTNTPLFQRFQKVNGKLIADIDGFAKGQWSAEMYLYAKEHQAGKNFQYVRTVTFVVSELSGNGQAVAPTGESDDKWAKNIMLNVTGGEIIIIIPLDHTNPYYEIRTTNPRWDKFSVEKGAYNRIGNMNEQVGSQLYECSQDCFGDDRFVGDRQSFVPFATRLITKSWNNGDVTVRITDTEEKMTWEFYHAWNR
jgi:hypothetical protein